MRRLAALLPVAVLGGCSLVDPNAAREPLGPVPTPVAVSAGVCGPTAECVVDGPLVLGLSAGMYGSSPTPLVARVRRTGTTVRVTLDGVGPSGMLAVNGPAMARLGLGSADVATLEVVLDGQVDRYALRPGAGPFSVRLDPVGTPSFTVPAPVR